MSVAGWVLWPFLLAATPGVTPAAEQDAARVADSDGSFTIPSVWYRAARAKGGRRSTQTGELTVSGRELVIKTRKRSYKISMDRIRLVSLGKLQGDVDTEWIVIELQDAQGKRMVGIRDGRKLGFGRQTRRIYSMLLEALERESAAQYAVPPGYRTYDRSMPQFALALPQGWSVAPLSRVYVDDRAPWGVLLFSAEELHRESADAASRAKRIDPRQLQRVLDGSTAAIVLERSEASKGMSCDGFTEHAIRELRLHIAGQAYLGDGFGELSAPTELDASIDGCRVLRFNAVRSGGSGGSLELDLRAVAHRDTLFVFAMRAPAGHLQAAPDLFETVLSSLKFPQAR